MAAHQAPLSLGFSRQEYWRGCHFLLQCMKVKSESEVAQSCSTLATPWTAAHQAPPEYVVTNAKVVHITGDFWSRQAMWQVNKCCIPPHGALPLPTPQA